MAGGSEVDGERSGTSDSADRGRRIPRMLRNDLKVDAINEFPVIVFEPKPAIKTLLFCLIEQKTILTIWIIDFGT
jgi:hypothetical protein